ncbi:HDOD domain-containing protein [Pseudoalteromonas sp. OOF1S-7]|uniref:HDOD domain-containing protein n=1 Tax=Pseudoalteromonas sp. OOF1S-7 TaxID=2917757 RepID=UPI001EF6AD78|nr:HDOD domain-containing protein [Pseudoalteromonas sp. OOF1S-7]MCG7533600.1 HDOD domain-containing protein [Pseudoalteromonas sp. OOF1S-7]
MIEIDNAVLKDMNHGFCLPAKPELLQSLHQLLQQPEPELGEIAALIATDVATSAAVLKVINSSSYGFSRTITDIRQAVMFLGLNSITMLVTGYLLKQAFDQSKCCIKLERFWDSAHEIADVATLIGNKIKSKVPVENLYMLGLFHDAGIPAMAFNYPDYVEVLGAANSNYDRMLVEFEEERYQTNHTVIGYYLANSWNLPKPICQLILRHHDVTYLQEKRTDEEMLTFSTLKMAENLVHTNKRFVAAPDWPIMKQSVLDALNLDEDDYQDLKDDTEEYFTT